MTNWSFCLVMIKKYFFSALVFDQRMLGFSLSSEAIRGLYCHLRSMNFPTPSKRASESIWLLRYNKNPIVTFCWSFFASCWYPTKTVSCWYFSENLGTCLSASDRRISFLFVNKSWILLITITTDKCYLVVVVVGDAFH